MGVHFDDASLREQAIMRGWTINHDGLFSFTSTHDLCDASYTRKGLETMVRQWYQWEQEQYLEVLAEYERNHPEVRGAVWAGKPPQEMTLDEWIFR